MSAPVGTPWPGPPIAAHAGGWDELLLIAVPLALFALFRWLAVRRGDKQSEESPGARSADDRPGD